MSKIEIPEDQPHPCVACGMCCNGTLFHFVQLQDHDDQSLFDQVYEEEGNAGFRQSCQHFDKCCTVYEKRPTNCREFKCRILKKFESGKLSYEKTMQLITKAKADAAFVLKKLPNDQNCAKFSMQDFQTKHKADLKSAAFRKENAALIFAVLRMKKARKVFLHQKKKSWLEKLGLRKKKKV